MIKPCLYILKSEKNGRYYIGSTNAIDRRIVEHNSGKTKSLRYHLPVKIVFTCYCSDIKEARRLELRLKKLKSRKIIEKIILNNNIDKMLEY